jgi:tRNA G18 (ribose-2'-O)-methylase SpoU
MKIVLDNIRSAWNVGAIIRTADAVNAEVILIGYTPKPVGNTLKLIKKTAIGAENNVKWYHFNTWSEVLANFSDGLHLGIEIDEKSVLIYDFLKERSLQTNQKSKNLELQKEVFIWFGNEIHGLSKETMENLDKTLHLPMLGQKESLNVASTVCTVSYLFLGENYKNPQNTSYSDPLE